MLTRTRSGLHPANRAMEALILACLMLTAGISTTQAQSINEPYQVVNPCEQVDSLEFNGTIANASITEQVDLGPRTTGSNGSADLRTMIHSELSHLDVANNTYSEHNITFTNVVAKYRPGEANTSRPRVVLVAHYDSRDVAERDPDQNRTLEPIPGANDAASGVAVLLELGRILPSMNLEYDVELLFTDAEDQNYSTGSLYGSRAWVDNQSESEVNRTTAFIVVDMVGDIFLQLTHVYPGDNDLWTTIPPLAAAIGLMDTKADCNGDLGRDIVNMTISTGVIDDHVPALNRGIRAIDLIDIRFGEGAEPFEGHWHTHEDTPDKVSAQSLEDVGRLVELGLRSNAWIFDFEAIEENQDQSQDTEVEESDSSSQELEVKRHTWLAFAALLGIGAAMTLMLVLGYAVNLRREQ